MRTIVLTATVMAFGAVACSSTGKSANKDDFSADLKLASATTMDLAAPAVNPTLLTSLETAPRTAPERAPTIKKAPEGERAVPSETPTVEAEPAIEEAAVEETEPVATTVAPAPAPVEINEPVAVAPRPTPAATVPAGGRGAGDYGTGGGVFGGGIGVVIRGGGVHGDNCELHTRGRRGGVLMGPVYVPRPATPVSGGSVVQPRRINIRPARMN